MKTNIILLGTATLALSACAGYGDSSSSGPRYTPRVNVAAEDYTRANNTEDRMDNKSYELYEQREQCQYYRRTPRQYDGVCNSPRQITNAVEYRTTEMKLLPIVHSYTILFAHDKSTIGPNGNETLEQIVREMESYAPSQITVTGYTDSSGKVDYNQKLSEKREEVVSRALMDRGIENQAIDRAARGEYEQAVVTDDGVRNQENRRVVIDFRR